MLSVTRRVSEVVQPYGGYLPVKAFQQISYDDGFLLTEENISAGLIGMAVDYLSRFMLGESLEKAFEISLAGARMIGESVTANRLLKKIRGIDDTSIVAACQLTGYDVCFRSSAAWYKPVNLIQPDDCTIKNIRVMVKRVFDFFDEVAYGPIIDSGITFEGGYTDTISFGDGDYLTAEAIWDVKTNKCKPTSKHTLQILVYYLMGLNSIHYQKYQRLKYLGIFNPRLNCSYLIKIESIPSKVIDDVLFGVIGYSEGKHRLNNYFYSVSEVARMLGLSKKEIRQCSDDGMLNAIKRGNSYVYPKEEFDAFVDYMYRKQKRQKNIKKIGFAAIVFVVLLLWYYIIR